jgi:hypothetical protein
MDIFMERKFTGIKLKTHYLSKQVTEYHTSLCQPIACGKERFVRA